MKKIASGLLLLALLTSCGKISSINNSSDSASTGEASSVSATDPDRAIKAGDTISVDYVGKLEDGTVFDSSIASEAKESKNYSASRKYEPLSFTVGAGQMIPGFDKGVVGMKVGEKKTLKIAPKDGYGEAVETQKFPKKIFADTISQTVPKEQFQDTISQTVDRKLLAEKAATVKVGEEIKAGQVTAKVTKVTDDKVTLSIENTQNPFYGKKLAVGLVGNFEGNVITVKKINQKDVIVEIDNKQNPFYGKKLAVGLSGTLPDGRTVTIKKIDGDSVMVEIPNSNELAGKTLIFDVEVKSIK